MNMFDSSSIKIEGYTADELLSLADAQIERLILSTEPIAFRIGSAEILGQFRITDATLVVELAHIDGGGEGVLPTLWLLAERYGLRRQLKRIEWIVHAVHCAAPNLKLRRVLDRKGFTVEIVSSGVEAYHYIQNISQAL